MFLNKCIFNKVIWCFMAMLLFSFTKTFAMTRVNVGSVSRAEALNCKQIKITYGTAIDPLSAQDLRNYVLNNPDGSKTTLGSSDLISVSKDRMNAVITLESVNKLINNSSYSIETNNVKAANGDMLASTSNGFYVLDGSAAVPKSVMAVNQTEVKIIYSAPVEKTSISDYYIDDGKIQPASIDNKPVNHSENSIMLRFGKELNQGNHTLSIIRSSSSGTAGFNGIKAGGGSFKFTVQNNKVKPTASVISVKPVDNYTVLIKIKFSKAVALNGAVFYLNQGSSNASISSPDKVIVAETADKVNCVTADSNGDVFTFNGKGYADTYNIYFPINYNDGKLNLSINNYSDKQPSSKKAIADTYGNSFNSTKLTANVSLDKKRPEVASITMTNYNKINVKYSKAVKNGTEISSYYIKDEAGNTILNSSLFGSYIDKDGHPYKIYDYSQKDGSYQIDIGADLKPGKYFLNVTGIYDTAAPSSNIIAAGDHPFIVKDITAPAINKITLDKSYAKVYVYYNKKMMVSGDGSILDKSKYNVFGIPLPDKAAITAANNDTIAVIELPNPQIIGTMGVKGVKDKSGNEISSTYVSGITVTSDDIIPTDFVLKNTKIIGEDTVTIEVDMPLSSIDGSKINLNGAPVASASYVNSDLSDGVQSGAIITLKVHPNYKWNKDRSNVMDNFINFNGKDALVNSFGSSLIGSFTDCNISKYSVQELQPALSQTQPPQTYGYDGFINKVRVTYTQPVKVSSVDTSTFSIEGYNINKVVEINPVTGQSGASAAKQFDLMVDRASQMDSGNTPNVVMQKPVVDAAGNGNIIPASVAYPTVDGTGPALKSITLVDENNNGVFDYEDGVYLNLSEPAIISPDGVYIESDSGYMKMTDPKAVNADSAGASIKWKLSASAVSMTKQIKILKGYIMDSTLLHNANEYDTIQTVPSVMGN